VTFTVKNGLNGGDASSTWLLNFALEYAIKKVQGNHEGLKLNDAHEILVRADYINLMGDGIHTIKEN
jgi:hypothetical protein